MSERPDIVPVGQIPELGVVPETMHAYAIRPERFGEPKQSFQHEELPVWELGAGKVLVQVMAAGVNLNGIWAGLGKPVNVLKGHGMGMYENKLHGTVSCLVGAPRPGLKNLEETLAAIANG